jgi:hypothetical protein
MQNFAGMLEVVVDDVVVVVVVVVITDTKVSPVMLWVALSIKIPENTAVPEAFSGTLTV